MNMIKEQDEKIRRQQEALEHIVANQDSKIQALHEKVEKMPETIQECHASMATDARKGRNGSGSSESSSMEIVKSEADKALEEMKTIMQNLTLRLEMVETKHSQ